MKKLSIVLVLFLTISVLSFSKNLMSVNVLNSTVKGEVVKGAKIYFEKSQNRIYAGETDIHGRLTMPNGIFGGIDNGSVKIIIEKEGFATLETKGPFNGLTFALSKSMKELDGYRVVLSWGNKPKDLDSHLRYNRNHIYWKSKKGNKANLDVDDTDGNGPETITIEKTLIGTKYIYAIHDYTNRKDLFSSKLSDSDAKVMVFIGSTQIETFYVPQGKIGNLWVLFSIDTYDNFNVINKFTTTHSIEATKNLLKNIMNDDSVLENKIAKDALTLNRKGESYHHKKSYKEAIKYYKKAILVKEDYSQAYSNLGLAYQKQGKMAEAIWANRRAIAIASGSNANRVKANSFYNVAKIFEKRGKYEDALQNYKWALENREHSAYRKGINRVKNLMK